MKTDHLTHALFRGAFTGLLGLFLIGGPAMADDFQRYLKIKNDLPVTIWPVIQNPLASNGGGKLDTRVARIFVNAGGAGNGIPPGQTVLVNVPKNGVGAYSWYQSQRVTLFTANPITLEARKNDVNMNTHRDDPQIPDLCPNEPAGACWSGIANAQYWLDVPAQIVEYTIMSKNFAPNVPIGTNPDGVWPNPDDTRGIPYIDIDVSYVDDVYLPVAMQLDDGGLTGYMGTTIAPIAFRDLTMGIIGDPQKYGWQSFAAYSDENWNNNFFNDLSPHITHIPSAFNILANPLVNGGSAMYVPTKSTGNPLPIAYMINNTTNIILPSPGKTGTATNPAMKGLLDRVGTWISGNPCADISKINAWPSNDPNFNKQAFCDAFRATVLWVKDYYVNDPGTKVDCATLANTDQYNYCVLAVFIGYKIGPLAGQLPETVQALMRNVPWGDGKTTPQYQWDKFLQYWAPYDSVFNLNPYVTLIKDKSAINAKSGYAFSIDDLWGNYQNRASGVIIDVGGSKALANQDSFDPYEKYSAVFGPNWDHARVTNCGNEASMPLKQQAQPISFSFWKNGIASQYCDITAYPKQAEDVHLNFRVVPYSVTATDQWTGLPQTVTGFKIADANFCTTNSSPTMLSYCGQITMNAALPADNGGGLENVYLSLPAAQRPIVFLNLPGL